MAVEELKTGKILIRERGAVSEALLVENDDNLYGEVQPRRNLNVHQLADLLAERINVDSVKNVGTQAVDIDIKRDIAIGRVDNDAVKSEIIEGKVNNKFDKLRALRRNGN